jgi:predicted PhzF superfamily epimerase YddE/YHI9
LTADLRKYRKLQWQVDAFSNGPFTGNPAGVVCSQFTIEFMQAVAMENNLAETSFIKLIPGTISEYSLRW